jgi:hypothetical protein
MIEEVEECRSADLPDEWARRQNSRRPRTLGLRRYDLMTEA